MNIKRESLDAMLEYSKGLRETIETLLSGGEVDSKLLGSWEKCEEAIKKSEKEVTDNITTILTKPGEATNSEVSKGLIACEQELKLKQAITIGTTRQSVPWVYRLQPGEKVPDKKFWGK